MPAPFPELAEVLARFLDRLDAHVREAGYEGAAIDMYLAGGLAVNFYCGSRYTGDIDASFSKRILLLQDDEMALQYLRSDGRPALLYFDRNYNPMFGLLHERHAKDSVEWTGIGNERRLVRLRVLSPVDLVISKLSRFSDQDQVDILEVAKVERVAYDVIEKRAREALADYVGNPESVLANLRALRRCLPGP